jgi:hypothetical protein
LWESVADEVNAEVYFEIRRLGPRVAGIVSYAADPVDVEGDTV